MLLVARFLPNVEASPRCSLCKLRIGTHVRPLRPVPLRVPIRRLEAALFTTTRESNLAPTKQRPLRAYQKECIQACLDLLNKGVRRQVVSLPVGSGKTVVFSNLISRIKPPTERATKTLVLAHRQELLSQARAQILLARPDLVVQLDQGQRHASVHDADVIVASVPALGRKDGQRLQKYNGDDFKCIIIDEAHHAAAATYVRILDHLGALSPNSHIFVWGCSATVRRHDGLRLGGIFHHVAYSRGFLEMMRENWLCNMRVTTVKTSTDLSKVRTHMEDFRIGELSAAVNVATRNEIVVRSWLELAADHRKSTLVFAADIAHADALAETFRSHGVQSETVSSLTPLDYRQNLLTSFKEGRIPVLVNCGILTEGTDIPNIDCVLLARPTKSSVLFQQMIGRGVRLHEGKQDCLVIDFVDGFRRGADALMTVPTLLGLDPSVIADNDDAIMLAESEKEQASKANNPEDADLSNIQLHITEYDNPYELSDQHAGDPTLHEISRLAWAAIGTDKYVLPLRDGVIRVERIHDKGEFSDSSQWKVTSRSVEKIYDDKQQRWRRIHRRPRTLPVTGDTLPSVIRAVDTWVSKSLGYFEASLLDRNARFRGDPATEKQLRLLQRLGWKPRNPEEPHVITKGQAATIITRLTEGAGKLWKQEMKRKNQREMRLLLQQEKKERDRNVDVGPLRDV